MWIPVAVGTLIGDMHMNWNTNLSPIFSIAHPFWEPMLSITLMLKSKSALCSKSKSTCIAATPSFVEATWIR